MTPDRIEFWRNNTTSTFRLTESEFNELLTIPPTDLQYQDAGSRWADNFSPPCRPESLVYRLKPALVTVTKTEEEMEAEAIVISGLSELAAAGVTANGEGVIPEEVPPDFQKDDGSVEKETVRRGISLEETLRRTELKGIKIEGGADRVFSTGAKRQASAGKGLPTLLPMDALLEISKHLEAAADKYGSRNWEKGLPLSSILDSLLRHIFAELMGDTTEEHARAIGCNTLFYIATKKRIQLGILPSELDDIPKYLGKKQEF
jgi:hypothetical protein